MSTESAYDRQAVTTALVGLFEARAATPDGRIRVEDLLNLAAAVTGEACIAAAAEFDPEHHTFTPGAVVMSDRINGILCDNASDWADTGMTVFGIIHAGALATGYTMDELPGLPDIFRVFVSGVADGSAEWGFVPLSVGEDHQPFVQPVRQAYELRLPVRTLLLEQKVPLADWPMACAFAVVAELGRVRDAIEHRVALSLVLETINGMAKTAPMTDEAMRAATRPEPTH